ncbi:DUF3267 domain-containing protein [Salinibacter altiplanensis]|uniref:DUF3267 domain-containing protein n=1 Tax=Salinibacter altiplanensis TaxID=1803181 RepID=UPI000C9FDB66|nr:DUF3267 domain-containing protein [Salinibacter altiplanensis]
MTDSSEAISSGETSDIGPQTPRLDRSEVSSAAMPIGRAQIRALVIMGIFALLAFLPHALIWGVPKGSLSISPMDGLFFGGLFIAGVVVHEGIHGFGYRWGGAAWSEIEFGVNWEGLAPYAHCAAPLRCGAYRRAIALPGLVLGALPLAAGLATGHWGTTLFAFVMLAAAGGDVLLLWMLRGVPRGEWVQDHPRKMGALVLGRGALEAAPRLSFDLETDTQESEEGGTKTVRLYLVIILVSAIVGGVVGFVAAIM